MNNLTTLLHTLTAAHITFTLTDDLTGFTAAPKSALTPTIISELRLHKPAIVEHLIRTAHTDAGAEYDRLHAGICYLQDHTVAIEQVTLDAYHAAGDRYRALQTALDGFTGLEGKSMEELWPTVAPDALAATTARVAAMAEQGTLLGATV